RGHHVLRSRPGSQRLHDPEIRTLRQALSEQLCRLARASQRTGKDHVEHQAQSCDFLDDVLETGDAFACERTQRVIRPARSSLGCNRMTYEIEFEAAPRHGVMAL